MAMWTRKDDDDGTMVILWHRERSQQEKLPAFNSPACDEGQLIGWLIIICESDEKKGGTLLTQWPMKMSSNKEMAEDCAIQRKQMRLIRRIC